MPFDTAAELADEIREALGGTSPNTQDQYTDAYLAKVMNEGIASLQGFLDDVDPEFMTDYVWAHINSGGGPGNSRTVIQEKHLLFQRMDDGLIDKGKWYTLGGRFLTGITSGVSTGKLIDDSPGVFDSRCVGMVARNTGSNTVTRCIAVDSASQLSLEEDIFTSGTTPYEIDVSDRGIRDVRKIFDESNNNIESPFELQRITQSEYARIKKGKYWTDLRAYMLDFASNSTNFDSQLNDVSREISIHWIPLIASGSGNKNFRVLFSFRHPKIWGDGFDDDNEQIKGKTSLVLANSLVDSTASFTNLVGAPVLNVDTGATTTVSVTAATVLTLNADIFTAIGQRYIVGLPFNNMATQQILMPTMYKPILKWLCVLIAVSKWPTETQRQAQAIAMLSLYPIPGRKFTLTETGQFNRAYNRISGAPRETTVARA